MTGVATIGNEKSYTVFRYGDHVIRFAAPYSLEYYTEVKEWDNGYMVVMAKYKQNQNPEEEYIDLVPILQNLYFDTESFLTPIKKVEVANEKQDNEFNTLPFAGFRRGKGVFCLSLLAVRPAS